MKSFYVYFIAALLAPLAITTSSAIEIDGTLDAEYGSPLAVQTLGTGFGDNNMGNLHAANGSELDAAYGFISNSVMYLFLAGNIEGATNNGTANKFEIFIDSVPGHGQNTLTNNNAGVDFGGLNRMGGAAGAGTNGLTFDAGFAPDYWIGTTAAGGPTSNTNNINFYANYAVLADNGGGIGYYMGTSSPTNGTLSGGTNPFGVRAAINNSNTAGVDGNGCVTNASMVAQSIAAGAVMTGMELSIPLSAVSSGTVTSVKVCVFLNGQNHDYISNQLLPPVDTNDCFGNIQEPRAANFGTIPGGPHYFLVPILGCNYSIAPLNALYPANGGADSVAVTAGAGCGWAATSQVAWVTITSGTSGSGNGVVNYSVATNTTTVGRSGSIIIGGQTFAINQYGQPLAIPIDGSVDTNHYGCQPLVVQVLGSTFSDSGLADTNFANGSELDSAYSVVENGVLYLVLGGNLSSDFTKLEIFFDTGAAGGQSTLTTNYPGVDFNGINRMGTDGNGATNATPGLTFDSGFAANYWMGITCGGSPFSVFANYAQLTPGGTNGYYLGSTVGSANGTLFGGDANPFGIQAAINNVNILGVTASGCYDFPEIYLQGSVMTGVELGIPLAALGSPTGAVKVCAFVNGSGHDLVSNQVLGPIWDGTTDGSFCQAVNLGEPSLVNFSALPGQHYFVVGPEMRITSIARAASTNINVSWLTGAGSNLVYQLQRTSTLSTAVWANVGSPTNNYGAPVSLTDLSAATNSTMFYRVQQSTVCP